MTGQYAIAAGIRRMSVRSRRIGSQSVSISIDFNKSMTTSNKRNFIKKKKSARTLLIRLSACILDFNPVEFQYA